MDHRVRDLDQIQEQDSDDRSRRLGTILMATAAIVGLSLAVGVVVGRAAEPPARTDDPLAKLERAAAVGTAAASPAPKPEPVAPSVQAADLSFPGTLTEDEERPEVLAALKAAEAEEAALGEPQPKTAPAKPAKAQPAAAVAADEDDQDSDDGVASAPAAKAEPPAPPSTTSTETMIANIPAAVAAGVGARNLRKAAKHDPLVAAAVHSEDVKTAAPHGHEGEFVLQVISYDRPEPSRAFAEGLRAKGHKAFVVTADLKERGKYFRVRVGPWKSREQAEAYRHQFEEQEHMNTFVVHEKENQVGPPAP